jgi:hypothetical protein
MVERSAHAVDARTTWLNVELNMSPPPMPTIAPVDNDETPASSLRRVVLKSALLNLVIVLTSFPVLVLAGGPRAVVPTLAIMAGITVVIWSATLILFSCVTLGRTTRAAFSSAIRRKPAVRAREAGVADRWLDAPG